MTKSGLREPAPFGSVSGLYETKCSGATTSPGGAALKAEILDLNLQRVGRCGILSLATSYSELIL